MPSFQLSCLFGLLTNTFYIPPSHYTASALMNFQTFNVTNAGLKDKFIDSNGDVIFGNVKASTHSAQCMKAFTNGHSLGKIIGTDTFLVPDKGIILSSGKPSDFNMNDGDAVTTQFANYGNNNYGDADLKEYVRQSMIEQGDLEPNQTPYAVFDACYLEFDFKCNSTAYVPQVSFRYVFGSEEYYEYVNSQFNDAFAFLLNGKNIAQLPTSTTTTKVVSINNVNYETNTQYFNGNDPGWTEAQGSLSDPDGVETGIFYPLVEADGFTTTLTAYGTPKGESEGWNKIKMVVGDVGDAFLDSWVLLEGGTFSCVDITSAPSMSSAPTSSPSASPSISNLPTEVPSTSPSLSSKPSKAPSSNPTLSSMPSGAPSAIPTISMQPTSSPSGMPSISSKPSGTPSDAPSVSSSPTSVPSMSPSISSMPSSHPSSSPSISSEPSSSPSESPSISSKPSNDPSSSPSISSMPSSSPSSSPSVSSSPSSQPSDAPSISSAPSSEPSSISSMPSGSPSDSPSISSDPTSIPSNQPSISALPSKSPSDQPTISSEPTLIPSSSPSVSSKPTVMHSHSPSVSSEPTVLHSDMPSVSLAPSRDPSASPSISTEPTSVPSGKPSISSMPSDSPSGSPSVSSEPSGRPSSSPSVSSAPSGSPSDKPSISSQPSGIPSDSPSISSEPSVHPSSSPSISSQPSESPSSKPSISSQPSGTPSNAPSVSSLPSSVPSLSPSVSSSPSESPSDAPSASPSDKPTVTPSASPSDAPSSIPSESPSISSEPSAQPSSSPSVSSKPTITGSYSPSISSSPSSSPTQLAFIGPARIFNDSNGNGLNDEGEDGIPDIVICLYDVIGNQIVNTTSDEDGYYQFEDVPPGTYYIEVQNPDDYEFSPVVNGGNQITSDESIPSGYGRSPLTQLALGDTEDSWNAGMYLPVEIGNKVWDDLNGNGYQDQGEPGMPNITAILVDDTGTEVARQSTDADGFYRFEGLPPGNYAVQFEIPENYVFTPVADLSSEMIPMEGGLLVGDFMADVNSETGVTATVEVLSGAVDLSFDAGIFIPVDVSGTTWHDLNANGIQEEGEPGLVGSVVTLYDSDGMPVSIQIVSDEDGVYSFDGLPPGEYYTKLVPPSPDYIFSPSGDGENNSDYNPENKQTAPVFLLSGQSGQGSFDAGLYMTATVGDFIWSDQSPNGIQDGDEVGFSEIVTIHLYDSTGTKVKTTQSDTSGSYKFDELIPGTYEIEFELPEGKMFTSQNNGINTNKDSNVDPTTNRAQVTLISGEVNNSIDAGVSVLASIAPTPVFDDLNGDGLLDDGEPGLPGVTVILYDVYANVIDQTTTDNDGLYSFDGIEPGYYYVEVQNGPGFVYSPLADGGNQISPDEESGFGTSPPANLVAGTVVDTWIAALYQPVSIGNKVWNDMNGDGLQDAGEPGMPNITSTLVDEDGNDLDQQLTDADGMYLFEGLPPGNYAVKFDIPEEFVFTPPAKLSTDITSAADGSLAYDDVTSDVNVDTGVTNTVMLQSGDANLSFDAGIFIPVSIGGFTWHDLNANGIQEEGEPGLQGSTVTLFDRDGDPVDVQTTIVNGTFLFEGLPPGTYHTLLSPPSSGYLLSPSGAGENDSDFDPDTMKTIPLLLQSGESGEGSFDAGLYLPASVGNWVWLDEKPNGIQDADEGYFDGDITVNIFDSLGYKVDTVTNPPGGFYLFEGLMPGEYDIEVLVPEGFLLTIQKQGNDTDIDSNFSPTSNRAKVTLTSGEVNESVDAGVMDEAPYYPDWTNDIQICTNDGFDPTWLEIQKVNYLYKNKEACCLQHFWWRMTQCMANEEYKFYRSGDMCDTKIFFEDWETNSPADWTATTQFDTLDECCANLFWDDYDGCMERSPVMFKFEFCVDVKKLVDPPDCQSADIYANVLEATMNAMLLEEEPTYRRLTHGDGVGMDANITKIGDVSLGRSSGSSTVCGGSLAGQGFTNEKTGLLPDIEAASNKTSSICGVITVEEDECAREDCLNEIFHNITHHLQEFVDNGSFTRTLHKMATTRLPPVPELQVVESVTGTMSTQNLLLPGTITGLLDLKFFFNGDPTTCDEKAYFKPNETPYETLHECCSTHFVWNIENCCSNGGGCPEIGIADVETAAPRYYAVYGDLYCDSKTKFENWEIPFNTREECCSKVFSYDKSACMDAAN